MNPRLDSIMVKSPYVGEEGDALKDAHDLMQDCNIRHLPIIKEGHLVGLVSDRDLRTAMALPQSEMLTLGDIMKNDVYVVSRDTDLRDVVTTMQERKIGSAVVVNSSDEVVGIFTTTDALGVLADLLDDDDDDNVISLDSYFDPWDSDERHLLNREI